MTLVVVPTHGNIFSVYIIRTTQSAYMSICDETKKAKLYQV